jgi:hypothetical protein
MGDQLAAVYMGERAVTRLAMSGDGAVCLTLDTNQIKCWRLNFYGELGQGDTVDRGTSPLGDSLLPVDVGPDSQDLQ